MKTSIPPALITLALACFALVQNAQAVVPAPDGGYPGFTTAEGTKALQNLTAGSANTAVGWFSLFSNAGGSFNTAAGAGSLLFNTADENTAFGAAALLFNSTGINNTAVGADALLHNTIAEENTATGAFALSSNTEGDFNTASGAFALWVNTIGERNTATGDSAMFSNTTGSRNTATGNTALGQNTTGHDNTATGTGALAANTVANSNTASGAGALGSNTTGPDNTADGFNALENNTTGSGNTAVGFTALQSSTGSGNTAMGDGALQFNTTGSFNIALGLSAGFNIIAGNSNIDIGNIGAPGESTTIRVGTVGTQTATFIAGISGVTVPAGVAVIIDANGHLGTSVSSARFKDEIKPMDKASEAILALTPVTFHYKNDSTDIPQFGLIAEEVAAVNPDLVVHDENGEIYTVRYDAVNAMLLNEFLKEHKKVEEQQATIAALESTIAQQQKGFDAKLAKQEKQIEALTTGLQKVSAQLATASPSGGGLELSKPAPQTVCLPAMVLREGGNDR